MKESYFFNKKKIFLGSLLLFIICLIIFSVLLWKYIANKRENKIDLPIHYYKCKEKQNSRIIADIFDDYSINSTSKLMCTLYLPCGYNNIEAELRNYRDSNRTKYIFGLNGCDKLVSKNSLWSIFENHYGRKASSKILPETFILGDDEDFQYLVQLYKKKK